ncbi:MAG: glycosyltransferase [Thermoproteota archaeon]|nr:glycosyltransferase [Thermoproteota archaeon]
MKAGRPSPSLSIIIPARNEKHYIKRCLQSLLSQRYENLEIIMVYDNSTDNTLAIAKTIKGRRLKLIPLKRTPPGLRLDAMTFNNSEGKLVLNNPVFYIDSVHKEENYISVTTAENAAILNDLYNVVLQVDKSSYPSLEKEEIKKILREFTTEAQSKPLSSILSNLKDKFKPYFHVASPYLQMLFSYFLRM